MIITSQRYLDDAIVASKVDAQDFGVTLSPEFIYGGETYQVVIDGHHSYAAARAVGVEPDYKTATASDCDTIGLLYSGDVESFLAASWMDSDYYDIETGVCVW